MKKTLSAVVVLGALCVLFALGACSSAGSSGSGSAEQAELPSFETLGDVFEVEADNSSYSYTETDFAYVYEYEGSQIRVTADMTEDVYKACDSISYEDEDHDAKVKEALSVLSVKSVVDLAEYTLSQEELDAYVGKTGQELLDAGFAQGNFYMTGDNPEFNLDKDYQSYTFVFNEPIAEGTDVEDVEQTIASMTVKSVSYYGLSDKASDPEMAEE